MNNYALVLTVNYPGAQWTQNGDDYEGIVWMDETITKPTKASLDKQYPDAQFKADTDKVSTARATAYAAVGGSDGIFFQVQRGEKTQQEWLDAVQAINDANPYPVKPAK